jgi:LuxR family maltose regulon positive regulatory protein
MSETLLRTKLSAPSLRPSLVPRPRLLKRVSAGMKVPLTLISAPAGYGKSTLVGEWRAGPGAKVPVAWLSLDAGDNDPARFWRYLATALNTLQEGLVDDAVSLFPSLQLPPIETLLTILINDLVEFPQDFLFVLEDVHVITSVEVHRMLAFLLDHLPRQMHLAILTRADPPLPLARLRVSGQLVEIRQRDLRFTTAEATTFLNEVMGLGLKEEDTEALLERTEGWIAGLQLAAITIHGRQDPSEVIATFGGGYRYIVDYLVQEVLGRLPESLRAFVLQTSVLDRLSGPLCDSLTGRSDSAAVLEKLRRDNVFLLQLGAECCWYRYHHLFVDVTRNLSRQTSPDQIPVLHRRAARWYEQNGHLPEAIGHALASGDWGYAGSLMDSYSSVVWRRGEITRVLDWVRQMPEEAVFAHPRLGVNYGWACVLTGRFEDCQTACERIEPLVRETPEFLVDWWTVQVFLARARGELERAVQLAYKAKAYPEVGKVETRALLMLSLCIALWDLGRIKESAAAAEEAISLAEKARDWHAWVVMHAFMGLAQAALGNLNLAKEIYRRAAPPSANVPEWAGGGFLQVCLSALYYEWNDLEQAEATALAGLEYSQITGHSEIEMNCYRQLAFIYQAQRQPQKAWDILGQGEKVIQKHYIPRLWGPEHIQVALAQGDLTKAKYWSQKVQGEYGAAIHYPAIPLESARLALAGGDISAAAALLAKRYQGASREGVRYAQIEIRILQAMATTDGARRMAYFCDALAWAEREGFCRVFVDQGEALEPLLREAAQKGCCPAYAVRLLSAIEMESDHLPSMAQPLVEPLSEREMQVLQLVASGRSNQEIADELVIALGTVKRHVYNIFGKLNVRSRTQCTARARELKLLK